MSAADRRLLGQQLAHADAGAVQLLVVQAAVGRARYTNSNRHSLGSIRSGRPGPQRTGAVGVDDQQLARLELADEVGAGDVERRRLRGQHPALVQLAQAQGPEAVRVADADEALVVEQDQRERALQRRQHRHEGRLQVVVGMGVEVADQQLGDQVAVAGDGPGQHAHLGGQGVGVGQVAVVAEGERHRSGAVGPGEEVRYTGWALCQRRRPGGRVAGVADGQVALEAGEVALVEDVGDQAHVLDDHHLGAVADRHAGRLLAAVLQGVEAVEGQVGHLAGPAPDAEHPARLSRRVGASARRGARAPLSHARGASRWFLRGPTAC